MANEINITLSIFEIFGGVALFLYGIKKVTKSLEDFAGAGLKMIITQLTKSNLRGFVIGMLVSLTLQSSGAVMLMLVAFANSGLLAVNEAISIILGAGVGTTLTVQLLAFRIHEWAPAMLLAGYLILDLTSGRVREIGKAVFSFGLVFLGMHLITNGAGPLSKEPFFPATVDFFRQTPFFAVIVAAVLTFAFQSSAVVLGVLLTLAFSDIIGIEAAIPFIVGANIGSSGIGFLGATRGKANGYRMATAGLLSRLSVGVLVLILADYYIDAAVFLSNSPARQIAHVHTLFALTMSVIFLPLSKLLTSASNVLVPKKAGEEFFRPIYIDPRWLSNPPAALGSAAREVLRQGDIVLSMMEDILTALGQNDKSLLDDVIARDDKVDRLQVDIVNYLTKLNESELSKSEAVIERQLLSFTLELEHIADVISKDIARHMEKRMDAGYYFSDEGWAEIKEYSNEIRALLRRGLDAIPLRDEKLAHEIIETTKELVVKQRRFTRNHIDRLHAGVKLSVETSAIHIDLINDLARIAVHVSHIAYAIMGKV
jgi:phosphate:Na+ symporter